MKISRAYKTELAPNNKQQTMFLKCAGTARHVYNWGLAEWKDWYEGGGHPSMGWIRGYFNDIKDEDFPWIREIPYAVTESAFRNLGAAYKNFFRRTKNGDKEPGYPKFKKKGRNDSFQLRGTRIEHDRVRLTHIGWVRLKERGHIPTTEGGARFGVYATISHKAGRWYLSVLVEEEVPEPQSDHSFSLGIDLGLKSLAVCSDGTIFENLHALKRQEHKLARLQRELSRRKKGGQNREKTKRKIQRCHAKIANIRSHALHQISYHVTAKTKPRTIVLEDLNVSGMMKNRCLSKAIADVGWAELRRQIEYKAKWYGIEVVIADRFFPSSRLCRECGLINHNLTLADRDWICECGEHHDRDLYAAENLAALAEPQNMRGLPVELGSSNSPL